MTILDFDGQPSVETDDKQRIETLTRKGWKARPEKPACGDDETVRWDDGKAWQIVAVAGIIPQTVSRFQGRAVLLQMGLLDSIEAAIRESGDAMLKLAWAEVTEFRRDSPMIAALAQQLGWDDARLDAMFVAASQVRA